MSQSLQLDNSTLATLYPSHAKPLEWPKQSHSTRLHGSHRFQLRRPNRAPVFSRSYFPGDPVSMIDWRAYARTDQLIVREKHDESGMQIRIGIDLSDSMWWPDASMTAELPELEPYKIQVALRAAYNLAFAYVLSGDFVELWLLRNGESVPSHVFKPRSPSDLVADFDRIFKGPATPETVSSSYQSGQWRSTSMGIGYWFGDGFHEEPIEGFISGFHRGCFYQTLSKYELDVEWLKDSISYFDSTVSNAEFLGSELREVDHFPSRLQSWITEWRIRMQKQMKFHMVLSSDTNIGTFQKSWLRLP